MANHLIHSLNFGDDKFGFGLPVVTSIEPFNWTDEYGSYTFGNLIIPNFVTSGAEDDAILPCFLLPRELVRQTQQMDYSEFMINGGIGSTLYQFRGLGESMEFYTNDTEYLVVAVNDEGEGFGTLNFLHGHTHKIDASSESTLNVDVVNSVDYTPGSFETNKPTEVSSTTANYLTDVEPQTTAIKQVTQVSTGSAISSLTTASKTASKVTHTTANFISSVGESDVTASKVTTTSHTIVAGVDPTQTTAVTDVSSSTDSAIQTLTSTTASVMSGVTETSAYVTETVTVTGGSAASLTASCVGGCLTLSWTPNTPTTVSSTTARVLTEVTPQTTNVLNSVEAATTASFVTEVSQSTTSVIGSITQTTASVTGVLSATDVTASKVDPKSEIAVNTVTADDVTFSVVDSVESTEIVTSVTTTDQDVITGITETSATAVGSITVTAGSAATYEAPTLTSTTTSLKHRHNIYASTHNNIPA